MMLYVKNISRIITVALFALLSLLPSNASATIVEGTVNSSKELNDFITHHVKDAHSWHIWGENKTQVNADGTVDVLSSTAIHIGLPVILIDNGLITANSDDFNELRWIEHDGDTTYYAQGKINETEYIMFHEKIYHLGSGLKLDEKGHPTNSRPLDFSLTQNVMSMLLSVVIYYCFSYLPQKSIKNRGFIQLQKDVKISWKYLSSL